MGLRTFHLFFIAVSVVLAAFVAAWAITEYRSVGNIGYIATALTSALAGGALAVYASKFQRKTRSM